jgi:hypothetical protein
MKSTRPLVIWCALMCASCSSVFVMEPGEPSASVNMSKLPFGWVCKDKKRQSLRSGTDGYAAVPAKRRVVLGRDVFWTDGINNYSCNPSLSFVPELGRKYFAMIEIRGNRCYPVVFIEDETQETGLRTDPTVGPGGC